MEDRQLGENGALFGLRATRTTGRAGISVGTLTGALSGGELGNTSFPVPSTWGEYHVSTTLWHTVGTRPNTTRHYLPLSYGYGTGSAPTAGSATWEGEAVSVSPVDADVYWDASMSVDFGAATPSLRLSDTELTWQDMRWGGVPMTAGGFATADGAEASLRGRFYGSDHAEAGGIFEARSERRTPREGASCPATFDGVFSVERQ